MTTMNFDESMKKFLSEQFANITKRYENYDPKIRSLMFLDKLHISLSALMTLILTEENPKIGNIEKDQCTEENKQKKINRIKLESEQLRNVFNVIKTELDALENYILTSSNSLENKRLPSQHESLKSQS